MRSLPATRAREALYRLLDEGAETSEPVQIDGPRSSALLVSAADWRAMEETTYLLSIPGMRESIVAGMAEPLEDSEENPGW